MIRPIPQLGKRIQALRERRGLTVQELADRAGTTYQSIWRIERGAQLDPSVALTRGIARALGVGVDHLVNMFGKNEDDDTELKPTAAALVRA
jgi:XRE family transcriptional regulator of biofilm formation